MSSKNGAVPGRKQDLVVQKLGDETLVYDQSTHRAHSLNRTASLVFEQLGGKGNLTAIGRAVAPRATQAQREALVSRAIHDLSEAGLLDAAVGKMPRRSMLRGVAAGLLPVVASVIVPPAVAAQSCDGFGSPCTPSFYGNNCCYGLNCVQVAYATYQCMAL
jgi:hypothetical protein